MNKYGIWGSVYAVINYLTPKGLTAKEINDATQRPGEHFARLHGRVIRNMPRWADERLIELLNQLDPEDFDLNLTLVQQGQWQLGYYHEKSRLIKQAEQVIARAGAPLAKDRINYAGMDWSKSDAELAREHGVTRQTMLKQRKRHAPQD